MNTENPSLETLQDIKRMMERSSRFISLSGLSGISAGIFALAGAFIAHVWLSEYQNFNNVNGGDADATFHLLIMKLLMLAICVVVCALGFAFYFTWKKTKSNSVPMWDHTSKKLIINLLIPLITGGIFILALFYHNEWLYVAPASLVFYGLALVNASKYTLTEIRYIGFFEIILGLVSMFYNEYGLYFWAAGFGVLHIIYGLIMWLRYDHK